MELRRPIDALVGRRTGDTPSSAASGPGPRPGGEWGHPADVEPLVREMVTVVADVAGLGLGVASAVIRLAPFPGRLEVTALLGLLESSPQLRRRVEQRVGAPFADLALGVTNALAQGLAQGPVGPLADLAYRAGRLGEMLGRRRAWQAREAGLAAHPSGGHPPSDEQTVPEARPVERPVPLPGGPLDRYAGKAWIASLLGFGSGLLVTGDVEQAAVALHAGLPRAARYGREAFSSRLGSALADRQAVVSDPWTLRLLDRVDCLVVEARALCPPGDPLHPTSEGLGVLAAARRSHLRTILLAEGGSPAWAALAADEVVVDEDPAAVVLRAQEEGRVVCAIAVGPSPLLAVADCGVGLCRKDEPVPWLAHVLAGPGLDEAELVVEACGAAVRVSRQSIVLAVAGGLAGTVLGIGGRLTGGPERAMAAVHGASLVAVLNGRRVARGLGRSLPPPGAGAGATR